MVSDLLIGVETTIYAAVILFFLRIPYTNLTQKINKLENEIEKIREDFNRVSAESLVSEAKLENIEKSVTEIKRYVEILVGR